jgi:AcrR family transcriptional regulator
VPRLKDTTRAARQAHILRAAVTCFARQGYHRTTMEDIAAEAGIAKGAAYVYFASKEELFLALSEDWDCTLQEKVAAALAALAPAERASLRRALAVTLAITGRHVQEDVAACRVLMEARTLAPFEPEIAARVRAADARAQARFEELLRAGVATGEWPPRTDVALHARLLRAALHGLMAQWHSVPGSFDWDAATAALATW